MNNLAQRSVQSTVWVAASSILRVGVLFVRFTLLSRWLPKSVFGIYATADAVLWLTNSLANFGLGAAFLHRVAETEDEEQAAALHFTLKALFTAAWVALLSLVALATTEGETRLALIVLALVRGVTELTQTGELVLTRRVQQQRLAVLELAIALGTTAAALTLAARGATLWALLATDMVAMLLSVVGLYLWRPAWRPRFAWSGPGVRYFLRFGSQSFLGGLLLRGLNDLDDLWTRLYLGNVPLADYSRAYAFASYPRIILANPLTQTIQGTYAELKEDHLRLSKAFFRVNALLVRSGFLLGGGLALVAPELIRLLLGEKWLTMLEAYRLMLLFTLLDPLKQSLAQLFLAVGRPRQVVYVRLAQLATLLIGLYTLGRPLGIAGVALAVNGMLAVGIGLFLWLVRPYVRYSLRRLFIVPTLALTLGSLAGLGAARLWATWANTQVHPYTFGDLAGLGADWLLLSVKGIPFVLVYLGVWLALERQEARSMWALIRRVVK